MTNRTIKFTVEAKKWFDKVNGNTYHACKITRTRDGETLACPYEYGYGDQYRQTALLAMAENKWLPVRYRDHTACGGAWNAFERENNYPIHWIVSEGLKRDVVALGE